MPHERPTETSLYEPVKRYLETLGFTVKGEVCGCDLVAIRGDEPPVVVIGELKLSFSLDLVLQAVDRTAACDEVWLAVSPGGGKRLRDPRVRKLCRFLGFGLLGVSSAGAVEVLIEPRPWRPRQDKKRRTRLIDEHRKRIGDPAPGGSTRQPIMTAYRQQALACAASLAEGPRRTSELRSVVPNAPSILLRNWYGWFTRIERGLYELTPEGALALARWQQRRLPQRQRHFSRTEKDVRLTAQDHPRRDEPAEAVEIRLPAGARSLVLLFGYISYYTAGRSLPTKSEEALVRPQADQGFFFGRAELSRLSSNSSAGSNKG
jgi:hypothetical protein